MKPTALKPFALDPNMLTLGGVFYPTGYIFLMFATEAEAFDWCRDDTLGMARKRVEGARAELDYAATDLRMLESLVDADDTVRAWRLREDKAREVSP